MEEESGKKATSKPPVAQRAGGILCEMYPKRDRWWISWFALSLLIWACNVDWADFAQSFCIFRESMRSIRPQHEVIMTEFHRWFISIQKAYQRIHVSRAPHIGKTVLGCFKKALARSNHFMAISVRRPGTIVWVSIKAYCQRLVYNITDKGLNIHIEVHMYIYIYIDISISIYTHIYIYVYMCVYTQAWI